MKRTFRNRVEAGRLLARKLAPFAGRPDTVVLALPRGGVPVGFEVAHALHLPLDVFLVRKLGVPGHEELAMGAIASGGAIFRNDRVIASFHITPVEMAAVVGRETTELQRRERVYRGDRPPLALEGKTVIVVDDGIATGSTMRAALEALRGGRPAVVVVAAPVIAADTANDLRTHADELYVVLVPDDLNAIGQYYADFGQTTDDEVRELLARCTTDGGCPPSRGTLSRRVPPKPREGSPAPVIPGRRGISAEG